MRGHFPHRSGPLREKRVAPEQLLPAARQNPHVGGHFRPMAETTSRRLTYDFMSRLTAGSVA